MYKTHFVDQRVYSVKILAENVILILTSLNLPPSLPSSLRKTKVTEILYCSKMFVASDIFVVPMFCLQRKVQLVEHEIMPQFRDKVYQMFTILKKIDLHKSPQFKKNNEVTQLYFCTQMFLSGIDNWGRLKLFSMRASESLDINYK